MAAQIKASFCYTPLPNAYVGLAAILQNLLNWSKQTTLLVIQPSNHRITQKIKPRF